MVRPPDTPLAYPDHTACITLLIGAAGYAVVIPAVWSDSTAGVDALLYLSLRAWREEKEVWRK